MGIASGNPNWENLPSQASPISAQALNNIENALDSSQSATNDLQTELSTRLSNAALQGMFPVYRVWDGAAYPPRIPGALNIFFGPTDPGLSMQGNDYWALPDVTTLAEVASAAQDPSTSLFAAITTVMGGNKVSVPMTPRQGDALPFESPVGEAGLLGYAMPPATTTFIAGVIPSPYGWNSARVRVNYYVPEDAAPGDVRISRSASTLRASTSPIAVSRISNTIPGPTAGQMGSFLITGNIDLVTRTHVSVVLERTGSSGIDTLASPLYCLSVELERTS